MVSSLNIYISVLKVDWLGLAGNDTGHKPYNSFSQDCEKFDTRKIFTRFLGVFLFFLPMDNILSVCTQIGILNLGQNTNHTFLSLYLK